MTAEQTKSISSAETHVSKPWPQVVILGQQIVNRLGLEESTDTLSRWMAHRIAELMTEAEQNEAVRSEAADLILRVWVRRGTWGTGWPPVDMANILHWAAKPDYHQSHEAPTGGSPWSRRLAALEELLSQEYTLWLWLALVEEPADEDDGIIDTLEDELDSQEVRLARLIAWHRKTSAEYFTRKLGPEASPAERAELAREELAALHERRQTLFEEAYQGLPKPHCQNEDESDDDRQAPTSV